MPAVAGIGPKRENSAMSAVIPFPMNRVRPMSETDGAGQAEVIIFPGVRVERLSFDLAERLSPSRRKSSSRTQPVDCELY
jgi:hypothetical protein